MFELRQEYDNIDLEASGSIEMDSESFKDLLLIQKGLETLIKHDKISKNHQKGRNQNYEEHLGKIEPQYFSEFYSRICAPEKRICVKIGTAHAGPWR